MGYLHYWLFGNVRENFVSAKSIKSIFAKLKKNATIRHDLPISVNNRVISQFCEDFVFTKLRICEVSGKLTLGKIYELTVLKFLISS